MVPLTVEFLAGAEKYTPPVGVGVGAGVGLEAGVGVGVGVCVRRAYAAF